MKKTDTIKLMIDSLADDRPKLFIFETEKEEIEINAMDFRDAVSVSYTHLTLPTICSV